MRHLQIIHCIEYFAESLLLTVTLLIIAIIFNYIQWNQNYYKLLLPPKFSSHKGTVTVNRGRVDTWRAHK